MQQHFYRLADHVTSLLRGPEVYTCSFAGETSDFVRFNRSAIRQPGRVTQSDVTLDLIVGLRHTAGTITLSGDLDADRERLKNLVEELRERLPHLPEDPHLLYSTEVRSSEIQQEDRLPRAADAVGAILDAGEGRDLVGIYAAGGIYRGFANSLGQRNWYASYSFNFDWSFYHEGDKAVKSSYAGLAWDQAAFEKKVSQATAQLKILTRPSRTITPGRYRVYLTPVAVLSILDMLGWGGFGLKDCRTRQSPLLKLVEGEVRLHESVTMSENTAGGVAPNFQSEGFIKPDRVVLIERGSHAGYLVSPRSAREYGVPTNGASVPEMPVSLDLATGDLPGERVLEKLGTGIWISNLWYLNYSDRPAGRITGMTRFATLWVRKGVIEAPLSVMRFDETFYRIFGEKLVGLTMDSELIMDSYTYGARSTASTRTPGALVDDVTFTL